MEAQAGDTNVRQTICCEKQHSLATNHTTKQKMTIVNEHLKRVTLIDVFLVTTSLFTYLIDTVTDMLVAAQYLHHGDFLWGILTLVFVVVPAIVIQIFSGRWYAADGKMKGCRCWVMHFFLLQPLERYLFVVVSGLEARKSSHEELINEYYYQQNDVSMLRLFEAFLESAPQLTLQVYVLLYTDQAHWLTGLSSCISLLALGWAVAAYSHALRKAYRDSYRVFWPSLLLQTLWHMGVVASRVIAVVVFTSVFHLWILLVIAIHWGLMTIWVILQNTDFCPSRGEEILFDCIIGVVYSFSFFNLKEGRTRWRLTAYTSLMLVENAALVVVWYLFRREHVWYDVYLLSAVFVLYALGTISMILYYRFCHPSGPIPLKGGSKERPGNFKNMEDSLPISRAPTYQSTPAIAHTQRIINTKPMIETPIKGLRTSTASLPRRALLKSQLSSRLNIKYQKVATPSPLSPIKATRGNHDDSCCRNVYADCTTLGLDENSAFHHFSVDASACFRISRCDTLEGSGVDLSRASLLDDRPTFQNQHHKSHNFDDTLELSTLAPDTRLDEDDPIGYDLDESRTSSEITRGSGSAETDSGHFTELSIQSGNRYTHPKESYRTCNLEHPHELLSSHASIDFLKSTRILRDADTL